MAQEIPLNSADAIFRQVTPIEGSAYVFDLDWSERSKGWYLDLYFREDGEETPVATGLRLVLSYPLLAHVTSALAPAGTLAVIGSEPTRDNLGTDARLFYFTEDEL